MSKVVAVLGGNGALGRAVLQQFTRANWHAISIDLSAAPKANQNIVITQHDSIESQSEGVYKALQESFASSEFPSSASRPLDAIVCTAGGWEGDGENGPGSDTFAGSCDRMLEVNLKPAIVAANLSAKLLAEGGLLTLIGAAGAVGPTPGMLGYGMAKAATHHLVQSLAVDDGLSAGFSGTLVRCDVAAVLPGVIDTAANRTNMADADFSSWTDPSDIADKILEWASAPHGSDVRPVNGGLFAVETAMNETTFRAM